MLLLGIGIGTPQLLLLRAKTQISKISYLNDNNKLSFF